MTGWLRMLAGPVLLAALGYLVDLEAIVARLRTLEPGWVVAAVALGVVQTVVSAWRWRYTGARLGIDLPFRTALTEYYLAIFLNQVLPGGVLGDANRAWRHAGRSRSGNSSAGPAVRSVILERAAGQLVIFLLAFLSAGIVAARVNRLGLWVGTIAVGLVAFAVGARMLEWSRRATSPLGQLARDARTAVFSREAWGVQLGTSALIVISYVLTYVCAAWAVGIDTPFAVLAPLVPPVLLAMLLPLSVAGWGVREAAAASLWGVVGLSVADGVAISVVYGLLVLVGTAPGAAVLALGGRYAAPREPDTRRRSRSKSTSSPSVK
ncbi:MAG: lysylphosphatidylglycerol synthase transmembrane domain-containing protein [Gemmatimonadota bacterium]|nr:lysylphosphatidylglycerol synthase transmembrane domain-containing protein [Gemmatimonadota bacterium]